MLRTFDALIVAPMRGSFLPRSYRSIHQPRGVFSTVLLKSVAVCFYAAPQRSNADQNGLRVGRGKGLITGMLLSHIHKVLSFINGFEMHVRAALFAYLHSLFDDTWMLVTSTFTTAVTWSVIE